MRGINPAFLNRLDEPQRNTILKVCGKFFADTFLFRPGEHGFVVGPTGSGKTNKGHNLANWLKHTDVILWISASKDNDIVPLLYMGKPVNIIIPKYAGIDITLHGQPHPNATYSTVITPEDVIYAIKRDHINILEVRNAFYDPANALDFMAQLFRLIAEWTRTGKMPTIEPPNSHTRKSRITVFLDESQWLIAGSRVASGDAHRTGTTSMISESLLEIRTYGWRLVIFTQGFTNVLPIVRENMPAVFLCGGADIKEPPKLRRHCNPSVPGWKRTSQYKRSECKYVDREGNSCPTGFPQSWPMYPRYLNTCPIHGCMSLIDVWERTEERVTYYGESFKLAGYKDCDVKEASRVSIKYARTYHDQPPKEAESETECFPELGRFSAMAIPPEKPAAPEYSRWNQ